MPLEPPILPPVAPGSVEERQKARLQAASMATGPDDLRALLDCLALWPSQDPPL